MTSVPQPLLLLPQPLQRRSRRHCVSIERPQLVGQLLSRGRIRGWRWSDGAFLPPWRGLRRRRARWRSRGSRRPATPLRGRRPSSEGRPGGPLGCRRRGRRRRVGPRRGSRRGGPAVVARPRGRPFHRRSVLRPGDAGADRRGRRTGRNPIRDEPYALAPRRRQDDRRATPWKAWPAWPSGRMKRSAPRNCSPPPPPSGSGSRRRWPRTAALPTPKSSPRPAPDWTPPHSPLPGNRARHGRWSRPSPRPWCWLKRWLERRPHLMPAAKRVGRDAEASARGHRPIPPVPAGKASAGAVARPRRQGISAPV